MEQKHIDEGIAHPVLGPHYFAARETVEKFMSAFEAEHFEPLIKKASEEFYDQILDHVKDHLLSDAEANLKDELWRGIEASVKALMTGERWALERYCLTAQYQDGAKIRAAVAQFVPAELQDARIKDLETEIAQLRTDNDWYRNHR